MPQIVTLGQLWVTADQFRDSVEGKTIPGLSDYTNNQINEVLLSIQNDIVNQGINYSVQTITDERQRLAFRYDQDIYVNTEWYPVNTVTKCKLQYSVDVFFNIDVSKIIIYPNRNIFRIPAPYIFNNSPATSIFTLNNVLMLDINNYDIVYSYTCGIGIPEDLKRALRLWTLDFFYKSALSEAVITAANSAIGTGSFSVTTLQPGGALQEFKTGDYMEKYSENKTTFSNQSSLTKGIFAGIKTNSVFYDEAQRILDKYRPYVLV